jgi:oligopeptide/dipeptide ABC transporter ATP-binding protein
MYAGRIVEQGPLDAVYTRPAHPYTLGLLQAMPDGREGGRLTPIPGLPPDPRRPPGGCAFHPRCPFATGVCRTEDPPLAESGGRSVACHHADQVGTARADQALAAHDAEVGAAHADQMGTAHDAEEDR